MKYNYRYYDIKRKILLHMKKILGDKISGIRYGNGILMSENEGNEWICERMLSGKPFMASRFGETEMRSVILRERGIKSIEQLETAGKNLCHNAGFFPCVKEYIDKYAELFINSIKDIDLMAIWLFVDNEEYMVKKYMDYAVCSFPRCLEPFYFEKPWSMFLEGKKVLVISPFVETITHQYKNRELLFENKNVLPKFDLKTIKAVQTIADQKDERFNDWFEALEWMKKEIANTDFDIALLGCGAYGVPLQSFIKRMGKQTIYMGGDCRFCSELKEKDGMRILLFPSSIMNIGQGH